MVTFGGFMGRGLLGSSKVTRTGEGSPPIGGVGSRTGQAWLMFGYYGNSSGALVAAS